MSVSRTAWIVARYAGLTLVVLGLIAVVAAPLTGEALFQDLWQVEPLAYIGVMMIILGLTIVSVSLAGRPRRPVPMNGQDVMRRWSRVTQDYFDMFGHDLGRPFRLILGKEREVRARLDESGRKVDGAVAELLDEIEQQAPNFRLMVANVQVLVQLEDTESTARLDPVDPAQIVRNIVDRYRRVAADRCVEMTWWSEPDEFGVVYSDGGAIDHIVTNLVDNAVRMATGHVEVRLTRNPTHFFVRVWDDGPGIPTRYHPHLFDRGWTPEVASRQERTSSGLGLFIARTLARRSGGDILLESVPEPDEGHHTLFTVTLPMQPAPSDGRH